MMLLLSDKASNLAAVDPHGFTISIVAVAVVFSALVLLYLAYSFVGYLCSGRIGSKNNQPQPVAECDAEIAAAIATALELARQEDDAHDSESYVITIKRH